MSGNSDSDATSFGKLHARVTRDTICTDSVRIFTFDIPTVGAFRLYLGMNKLITFVFFIPLLLISCATKKNFQDIHVETLLKTTKSWNGSDLPYYSDGVPEITILKITIPPKTSLKMHKHPFINAGILTKGNLTVVTEMDQTLHLRKGDSISELVNTWHYGKNTGSKPAEIIVFYAGIEGEPISIIRE